MAKKSKSEPIVVLVDREQWAEKSKKTLAYELRGAVYSDIHYSCWHCQKPAIFSAEEQKISFELKKNPIDQRRILCPECWHQSHLIMDEIHGCEEQWKNSKKTLRTDSAFLSRWLMNLKALESYVPSKPNTAAKNMIAKLLGHSELNKTKSE